MNYVGAILSFISGFASTYLVYRYQNSVGFVFPGLLFTSTTVLMFILTGKSFRLYNLLCYYLLMNVTCLTLWILTFICSYLGLITGIFAGGLGAFLTFYFANRFIVHLQYNRYTLLYVGGIPFIITLLVQIILNLTIDRSLFEYLFNLQGSVSTMFVEVFLFWQTSVGTKLIFALNSKK
jgi:hypothetical protein